jgi:hypothetical protein
MAAKAASGDGPNSWSMWRRLVDRGLNDDLLFGDTWSCGLRSLTQGGRRRTSDAVAGGLGEEQQRLLIGVGCSGCRGER